MSDTHYAALGLSEDAAAEEVKSAWKRAAKDTHPDTHPDDPTAAARFKTANAAYEVLSDADRRAEYDEELRVERAPRPPPCAPSVSPSPPPTPCAVCGLPTAQPGRLRCSVCEANRRARAQSVPRAPKPSGAFMEPYGLRLSPAYGYGCHGMEQDRLEAAFGHLGYWTRHGVPRWKL